MKLALIASGAAIAVFAGASTLGPPPNPVEPVNGKPMMVTRASLREDMRKLWTDHVVWTRAYIVATTGSEPGAVEALKRLMVNQEEIGAAVGSFYGTATGDKLTGLLKAHIAQAGDVVKAAKAGTNEELAAKQKIWFQNADDIAEFLASANPNWKVGTLKDMMHMHLTTTTDEATARLKKDWDGDVRAYDHVYEHALRMSDALADGIAKQFPLKVSAEK